MIHLTKKDWAIVGLFFLFLLVIVPLFAFVDETPLERVLPPAVSLFAGIGFVLSMPINFILGTFGASPPIDVALTSWLTAGAYSVLLASILSKLNNEEGRHYPLTKNSTRTNVSQKMKRR